MYFIFEGIKYVYNSKTCLGDLYVSTKSSNFALFVLYKNLKKSKTAYIYGKVFYNPDGTINLEALVIFKSRVVITFNE